MKGYETEENTIGTHSARRLHTFHPHTGHAVQVPLSEKRVQMPGQVSKRKTEVLKQKIGNRRKLTSF